MIEVKKSSIDENTAELWVKGEIDASSSIHLDNAMEESFHAHHQLVIDLTELNYISSAGLGVFISRLDDLKKQEKRMVLFGLNKNVQHVFDILGLSDLLEIVGDREAALATLQ
jgi:anti-sigma B factor antagonist